MSFAPYVFYSGNCAEAFSFYHSVFGGKLDVLTHADLPAGAEPMPGATPDSVMHAALKIGDTLLMGSDDPTGDGGAKVGVAVSYTCADTDETRRVFDALAADGETVMPLSEEFWSPAFGVVNDRFGLQWMVDTASDYVPPSS